MPLAVSGFFGIFVGDSLLFATLTRLGPRRTGILYALNAPIAALIAWLALGETLAPQTLAGVAVTVAGVILAILFGKRRGQLHQWESVRGPLWLGVGPRARRGDRAGARLDRRASGDGRGGRSVRRLAGAGRRRRDLPVGAGAAADRRGPAEGAG